MQVLNKESCNQDKETNIVNSIMYLIRECDANGIDQISKMLKQTLKEIELSSDHEKSTLAHNPIAKFLISYMELNDKQKEVILSLIKLDTGSELH